MFNKAYAINSATGVYSATWDDIAPRSHAQRLKELLEHLAVIRVASVILKAQMGYVFRLPECRNSPVCGNLDCKFLEDVLRYSSQVIDPTMRVCPVGVQLSREDLPPIEEKYFSSLCAVWGYHGLRTMLLKHWYRAVIEAHNAFLKIEHWTCTELECQQGCTLGIVRNDVYDVKRYLLDPILARHRENLDLDEGEAKAIRRVEEASGFIQLIPEKPKATNHPFGYYYR